MTPEIYHKSMFLSWAWADGDTLKGFLTAAPETTLFLFAAKEPGRGDLFGAFLGTLQFHFASGEAVKYTIRQGTRVNQIRVDGYPGDHGWDWLMRQLRGKLAIPRRELV